MQKIYLKNFGPIKEFEVEIKDIMFFIGPQASGKSTISKSLFFFRTIKDELLKFIADKEGEDLKRLFDGFVKTLKGRFIDFFGTTKYMSPFVIEYHYSNDKKLTLSLKDGYVQIHFNTTLTRELKSLFDVVIKHHHKRLSRGYMAIDNFIQLSETKKYQRTIENQTNRLFEDSRTPIFIPAGRSLLATLADQIQNINPDNLDFCTRTFVNKINYLKPFFKDNLWSLVEDKKQLSMEKIDFEQVKLALSIIKRILKGEYQADSDGEKIYFDDNQFTKLQYSSSGQQEAVWILLLIFKHILDRTKTFAIFEEPEAHLYPEAQNDIVELICLLANVYSDNQVIVTTHSPYILSAFNNLLYAYPVGAKNKAVSDIVDKKIWINPNRAVAIFISKEGTESIIDEELQLIKAEKIDSASQMINDKYDKLFDMDD